MLSLLAQGNTGDEILSILDALIADNVSEDADTLGTLNPIEFWSLGALGVWHSGGVYVMISDIVIRQWFAADLL